MADTLIPVRLAYTGNIPVALAEYQNGEAMALKGPLKLPGALTMGVDQSANPIVEKKNGLIYVTDGRILHYCAGGPTYVIGTNGTDYMQFFFNGTAALTGSITTNGTTTAFNTSSDYRLKDNVQPLDEDEAEARILAYRPVIWTWKIDGSYGKGFIAHWNQEVDPSTATGVKDQVRRMGYLTSSDSRMMEMVEEPVDLSVYGAGAAWEFVEEQPVYQGRDDTKMIPDMVAMLQKMRRELDEARAEIALLKSA